MKQLLTLLAVVLISASAFAQQQQARIGIYRSLDLDNLTLGDCSTKTNFGITVTPIRGNNTKYRDEQGQSISTSDLYIGYSLSNAAKDNKTASKVTANDCVIFPTTQQSSRQTEEYFGYTIEIPSDKPINIDALDVYMIQGNALYLAS